MLGGGLFAEVRTLSQATVVYVLSLLLSSETELTSPGATECRHDCCAGDNTVLDILSHHSLSCEDS